MIFVESGGKGGFTSMKNANSPTPTAVLRPPIVVVLGHVDHGKTTLLDAIRQTDVAQKEAGGITQSIGASVIEKEGKKITFIDTPGHEAFSNMRSRGAKVADLAILVVASDDGVKPQTIEALRHIRLARIPFIVAATKVDLPTASVENVRSQLEKEGVLFEGRGGDVPLIPISAKEGKGVREIIEMILLISELYEIKGDPQGGLEAVIIEVGKGREGITASVLVRNGKLRVGDEIVSDGIQAKVRALFDFRQRPIKEIGPGEPAKILGFEDLPKVGSLVSHKKNIPILTPTEFEESVKTTPTSKSVLPIILKANSAGSLEAILASLPKEVSVINSGVGEVTESDVLLAKPSQARIFSFGLKVPGQVSKLAENEMVIIESFEIIYELLERLEELIKEGKVEVLGVGNILKEFVFEGKRVAGCKVSLGRINIKDVLTLKRGEAILGEVKILSLRKGKTDVSEVKEGEECGILFTPQLDFRVGDMLLSLRK